MVAALAVTLYETALRGAETMRFYYTRVFPVLGTNYLRAYQKMIIYVILHQISTTTDGGGAFRGHFRLVWCGYMIACCRTYVRGCCREARGYRSPGQIPSTPSEN